MRVTGTVHNVAPAAIGAPPRRSAARTNFDLERKALEVASRLQSTLDIEQLVALFAEELAALVPHDGISFLSESDAVAACYGADAPHACDYELRLGPTVLGRIVLRRAVPFGEEETHAVETLLCALVYPLRNALLYRRALATALTDPVTGINNRAAMDQTLEREVELAHRHRIPLSLIMLDVDRFKQINDEHGHLTGDEILRQVARCIAECIRRSDVLFRYGGEEFAIVLANTELYGATLLAQRVRSAVERMPVRHGEAEVPVTVSVGVSQLEDGDEAVDLIAKADRALYRAKEQGRNRVVEYAA